MKENYKKNIGRLLRGAQSRNLGEILLKNSDLSEEEKAKMLLDNPPFGVTRNGPGLREQLKHPPTPYAGVSKEDLKFIREVFTKGLSAKKRKKNHSENWRNNL